MNPKNTVLGRAAVFALLCGMIAAGCKDKDDDDKNDGSVAANVYVGVIAFNDTVTVSALSNNLDTAKNFISNATNTVDATALCYAVSEGVALFGQNGSPDFNRTFLVTFTDGVDNCSSNLYVASGKKVPQSQVYDQAETDLNAKPGLKSYAIGFTGNEPVNDTDMRKLVQGGEYKTARDLPGLNNAFKSTVANILAALGNITLRRH